MAEELVELGKSRRGASSLTGVRCLSLGRTLARAECGLAYAARAIQNGKAADLQMGLVTVKVAAILASQLMPQGGSVARKIASTVTTMGRELRNGSKISKSKATAMFQKLQVLKLDVDRLFATGATACPGGKR